MEKKFELTTETIVVENKTLYRIRALKNFNWASKGDLGGFVEKESNLSHSGDCWIFGDAKVFDDAVVSGDAGIHDDARVYGNAKVLGNALVGEKARIYGNAEVSGSAQVEDAEVYDNALIRDYAEVYDHVKVYDHAILEDGAYVCNDSDKLTAAEIHGSARIGGLFKVDGPVEISQGDNLEAITIHSTLQWHKLRTLVSELDEEFNKD